MTTQGTIAVAVTSIFLYVCGGLAFNTKMLVGWGRSNYNKSRLVRAYPFANIVMKPWYPAYIRGAGIFIWLWALAVDYLALFRGFH